MSCMDLYRIIGGLKLNIVIISALKRGSKIEFLYEWRSYICMQLFHIGRIHIKGKKYYVEILIKPGFSNY